MTTVCSTAARPIPPSTAVLEANLSALARSSPQAVRLIRNATPRPDIEFIATDDSGPGGQVLSAQIGSGPASRALASRRRPLAEAKRLADQADIASAGCIVVSGFGAGHHLAAVAQRMQRTGVIICFEPDLALLRAVLERVDHSAWMAACNFVLLTDEADTDAMARSVNGLEVVIALGVSLVSHPALRVLLGDAATRFETNFKQVVENVSITVQTTMSLVDATIRNLTLNLDRYASCPGIADLKDAAAGHPAIVVSAGPSLRRNIDLLTDPAVRARFILIAAQTVLKPLLARGIRPDFVTALDYHEISRRFYEGLGAADVAGVTLVVEPKANPAILDAFPIGGGGAIRCVADSFLDELLGENLRKDSGDGRASIPPGATVSHLAYYLARHLGCDPVVLIGQDLGFTDGQYYAAGAAIHDVWAAELNPFNTLEMMEWQRIVRMRRDLRKAADTLGRPLYTDLQMNNYLAQFERDFKRDADRGLTIIDATEGGVAKRSTTAMPLAQVIADSPSQREGAGGWAPPVGSLTLPPPPPPNRAALPKVADRLRQIRRDTWRVGELSRKTTTLLREMLDHHEDQPRVNDLIGRVERIRDEVMAIQPAFNLVQRLNQTGTFRRFRTDRSIHLDETLSETARQRRRIERDLENVSWLADAADALGTILEDAIASLPTAAGGRGAPKQTRETATPAPADVASKSGPPGLRCHTTPRVAAIIPVLHDRAHLGTARDLAAPFLLSASPLRLTLLRLARCKRLDAVILLTDDPERTRRLAGDPIPGLRLSVIAADLAPLRDRQRAIRPARLWADSSWRGGIGGLTCFDELLDAPLMARAMASTDNGGVGYDAALLVGSDWCLVDPDLCDALIERHAELPKVFRLTFTQAPPGLAGCVVARPLMDTLAAAWPVAGPVASLASVLGYNPAAPTIDPIALPQFQPCVQVPAAVRDTLQRFVPDSPARRTLLAGALSSLGDKFLTADAATIAGLVAERSISAAPDLPPQVVIELCTGRRTSGRRGHWERGSIGAVERPPMSRAMADRIIAQLAAAADNSTGRPDVALTFAGAGDPLLHPDALDIIAAAKQAGIGAVHVRTDLLCDRDVLDRLLDSGVDVISVDLMADTAETYKAIMGIDRFEHARANLLHLLESRRARATAGGLPHPWIVPRITRCDPAYSEIEPFYDRWLIAAGAAVIDALPLTIPRERIAPLPRPAGVRRRDLRSRMTIYSDGSVPIGEKDLHGASGFIGNATHDTIATLWRELTQARRELERLHGDDHPDLQMGY